MKTLDRELAALLAEAEKKNMYVIKDVERTAKELPDIPQKDAKINAKEPVNIMTPLQEAQAFSMFVSGEMELLLKNFRNILLDQKNKLKQTMEMMI